MRWFKREKKIGGWLSTYTGKKVYPLALRDEDIDIEDIAWSLSMLARYVGQSKTFYSVAQHCVLVADVLQVYRFRSPKDIPSYLPLAGLLHDGCEAYLGDFPGPIKRVFPDFVAREAEIEEKIWARFGLSMSNYDKNVVGNVDKVMVSYEMPFLDLPMFDSPLAKLRLSPTTEMNWAVKIEAQSQIEAHRTFMERFERFMRTAKEL